MTDVINNREEINVDEMPEADISIDTVGNEVSSENNEPASAHQPMASDLAKGENTVDYEALMLQDVTELKREFPELSGIESVTDLHNPLRYAALRDMGLTPAEAYLATAKRVAVDTRAHLRSAHGRSAAASSLGMSQVELAMAREIFPGKNDAELQRLYKRVSK